MDILKFYFCCSTFIFKDTTSNYTEAKAQIMKAPMEENYVV